MSNSILQRQKDEKNDEYYTRYEDVGAEVLLYRSSFAGRIVYCPCDDPNWSAFYKFFTDHFDDLRLKRLICTWLGGYRLEFDGTHIYMLWGEGDFRKNVIQDGAIICTNPPFSLFRDFRDWCGDHDVLCIGNINALFCKNIWNTGWHYGQNFPSIFTHNSITKRCGGLFCWLTNLEPDMPYHRRDVRFVPVDPEKHKYADNYRNTINCDTSKALPDTYEAVIAAPIDILKKDLSGFDVVGITANFAHSGLCMGGDAHGLVIGNRKTFKRVLLRRKKCNTQKSYQ